MPCEAISQEASFHRVCLMGTIALRGHYQFCTLSMGTKCLHKVYTVTHTPTHKDKNFRMRVWGEMGVCVFVFVLFVFEMLASLA